MTEKDRILAVDYGRARVGIAVSDPLRFFAIPLITIKNDNNFWKNFEEIISEYKIEKIILGHPLKEDGSKSEMTLEVEKFKLILEKKANLIVELYDERYSSSIAHERIIKSVSSKKKRKDKGLVDKNAAAVFLEDYMEHEKNH